MSYIIKTYDGDTTIYFHRVCGRVRQYPDKGIPAFRVEIKDAYIFDTKERAYRMMAQIAGKYPELNLELEEIETSKLRGEDGYVPLEKTVKAMLSGDYRHRLWAEYEQLNTRRHLLKERRKTCTTEFANTLNMDEQINHMHEYMIDLLEKCRLNDIDLTEVEKEIES